MEAVRRRALERGDVVVPGLDQVALSRHENGHKRPSPYYQVLYCEVYGATPAELGFRLALPGDNGHPENVDRREFLTGAAGFVAAAALPSIPTRRLGSEDVARLRQSVAQLHKLGDQHGGAGAVHGMTVRTFDRLRALVERAGYDQVTGKALRDLTGEAAAKVGWLAFDAGRPDDARRWWLEAMHWSRLAESDSVSVHAMAMMARQAIDQRRPREAIEARDDRTAHRCERGNAALEVAVARSRGVGARWRGRRSERSCRPAPRSRTRRDAPRRRPGLDRLYGAADFASQEHRVALMLGDIAAAEDAARSVLALDDPVAYPCNHVLYLTYR